MSVTNTRTILLVEDETIIAMAQRSVLEKYGYRVVVAKSGEKALTVAGNNGIDLVLMDIDLGPGMDGTETAEKILEARELPLIFLSSHTAPEVVEKTEGITSYGYIVKNSGETVLNAAIKMAFRLFEAKKNELAKERALQESEERWKFALEGAAHGVWDLDLATNHMYVSRNAREILGFEEQEIDDALDALATRIHPDDREWVLAATREHIFGDMPMYDIQYRLRRDDGSYKWVWDRGKVMTRTDLGKPLRIVGTVTDITERKEAEAALRESEARFRELFQDVPVISVQGYTADGTIRYWNQASEELYGYAAEEAVGRNIVDLIIPEQMRTTVQRDIRHMVETGNPIPASEMSLIRKDGSKVPVFTTHTVVKKYEGAPEVFSLDIDLSETVRKGRTAYAGEERWELALKGAGHGVWDFDLLDNRIFISRSVMSMLGLEEQKYGNAHEEWVARLHPDDRGRVLAATDEHFFGETETRTIEYRLRSEDGTYRWVRDQGAIVAWTDKGKPARATGTVTEITDRKKIEFKLKESESRLAAFTRALPDLGFIVGPRGRVIEVIARNDELRYLPADRIRGKRIGEYLPSNQAELLMNAIGRTFETGVSQTVEYDLEVIGGHRWFEGRTALMENRSGESRRAVMIVRDITKRKHTEQQVLQLVQQKEVLLKEAHHRIKNNLNVIKSLLSLQAAAEDGGVCADTLLDAASRVQTMMTLYDRLYRSELYHESNLGDLLRTLVPEIVDSVSTNRRRDIRTIVEVEDIVLNARLLAPVGIMLNEMITNSVKHAFHGVESAVIRVFGSREDNTVTLQCADNGIGLPATLPADSGATFGLQLIRILTEQLNGRLQVERSGGTSYTVRFEV